jgi:hypothetical protein
VSRWFPDRLLLRLVPQAGETPVEAFERQLEALAPSRSTRITCALGGDVVRWRVVPWNDALAKPSQRQALAESCFADAYGEIAKGWDVRLQHGSFGRATLACAVDAGLPDRLDAAARERGLRLVSVQPSLMLAHNGVRKHLVEELFWFVWCEGPWRTLLLMSGREPLQLKQVPASGEALSRCLDREWFALGMEVERCPVYVAQPGEQAQPAAEPPGAWSIVHLESPSSEGELAASGPDAQRLHPA